MIHLVASELVMITSACFDLNASIRFSARATTGIMDGCHRRISACHTDSRFDLTAITSMRPVPFAAQWSMAGRVLPVPGSLMSKTKGSLFKSRSVFFWCFQGVGRRGFFTEVAFQVKGDVSDKDLYVIFGVYDGAALEKSDKQYGSPHRNSSEKP